MNGRLDASPKPRGDVMSFAAAKRLLDRLMAISPDQFDSKRLRIVEQVMAEASPLERSLLNATLMQPVPSKADTEGPSAYSVSAALKRIHAPGYSIARSVQRLEDKLDL
jgi:hypothetical protein